MKIEIDYILWNSDKSKIKKFKTLTVTEEDIIDMMIKKYNDDELPVPIYLNKDDLVVDFSIRGGSF